MEKDFFLGKRWGGRGVLVRCQREKEKEIQFEFSGKRDGGRNLETIKSAFWMGIGAGVRKNIIV